MPEFKVVVSDPEAKSPRAIPIMIKGAEDLEFSEKHKEQRELIKAKANPKLIELIDAKYGVAVVRIWKGGYGKDKVNVTVKVVGDPSLDVQTIALPAALMREKVGSMSALGEILRAPSFQIRVSGEVAARIINMKIGDRIDGRIVGLPNVLLEIRGGSDLAGFPMRSDIEGPVKKYVLLSKGPGFRPKEDGERRRKLVRGNTISEDIVQVNTVIIKAD